VRSLGVGRTSGPGLDTIVHETDKAGNINMPLVVRAGMTLEKRDFWTIGADVTFSKWEDFRMFGSTDSLKNSLSVSLGGSIIPKYNDYKNYLKRVEYRAGLRYDNGSLSVYGKNIQLYGASVGLGLPLGKSKSKVNMSFEYYVKGTKESNLLKEEYFRFVIGVTVSDKWFQRYKYD
jgi:hypothetical protein